MKQIVIGLILAICLLGCDEQPSFSIDQNDFNSKYAQNKHFKPVYKRGYHYYFKGGLSSYYGIDMKTKHILSGYIYFTGPNASLCLSQLNFKGRKTFNDLLKALKQKKLIDDTLRPYDDLGVIEYSNKWAYEYAKVNLVYYTDFGYGTLRVQSNGCLKAIF